MGLLYLVDELIVSTVQPFSFRMKDFKWLDKVREVCKTNDDDYGYADPIECPECAKVEVSCFEFLLIF